MTAAAVRWGFVGTGRMAGHLADALRLVPGSELAAVASRSTDRAATFARAHGAARHYGSYDALLADDDVDVVYIATPNPFHAAQAVSALRGGKAVLCEKPFAMTAAEAEAVVDAAKTAGRFLMEAMWTRHLPLVRRMTDLVAAGVVGDVHLLQADLGMRAEYDPAGRLFNPALGGGALLDLGVYPLSLACLLFGPPEAVQAGESRGATGVDEYGAAVLRHAGGRFTTLTMSLVTDTPREAVVMGSTGHLRLRSPWYRAEELTVHRYGEPDEVVRVPCLGRGYAHQVMEVNRCVTEGLIESPVLPWADTLAVMRTLDAVRAASAGGGAVEVAR